MKTLSTFTMLLFGSCIVLSMKQYEMRKELDQLQTSCAIAMLAAEAANKQIGADASFFAKDREMFIKAWEDNATLPVAVFPDNVLGPVREQREQRRNSKGQRELRSMLFGQ